MRKYILFIVLVSTVFAACKEKTEYDDATKYNNAIIEMQEKIYHAVDSLEIMINADVLEIDKIKDTYDYTKSISQEVLEQIDNTSPYMNDKEFYSVAKKLFSTFDDLLDDEYLKLIKYVEKPSKQWTDQDHVLYYDIWDKLEEEIIEAENDFFDAQEKFVELNEIEFE